MQRKGYYTGKRVYSTNLKQIVVVGKISGYRGTGEPVYDLLSKGEKVGEMGNPEIKINRKKFYDMLVLSRISMRDI